MINYHSYRKAIKRLCLKAEVPIVSSHGLRHSTAEIWMENGASEEDIRELLTQKSSKTVRRYIHRTSNRLHSIAQNVGQQANI